MESYVKMNMNKNIIFLGDVHGNLKYCRKICQTNPNDIIVQIGDLGVGFVDLKDLNRLFVSCQQFHFFVGNHDNRQLAQKMSRNLGARI